MSYEKANKSLKILGGESVLEEQLFTKDLVKPGGIQ
ncbi:MAG: hypothetical protein Ct9H300mP28_30030 [Pseudomonadota bacterium]|nr:MAG: hypothetical protein Ct9H300mP28_30030 [Pseudomonadota bacterium]